MKPKPFWPLPLYSSLVHGSSSFHVYQSRADAAGWFEILEGGRCQARFTRRGQVVRPKLDAEYIGINRRFSRAGRCRPMHPAVRPSSGCATWLPADHDFPRHGHIKKRVSDFDLVHFPTDPALNVLCYLPDLGQIGRVRRNIAFALLLRSGASKRQEWRH